jgi:cobalamin 5'-phosphate synthase/cobalamin synthase
MATRSATLIRPAAGAVAFLTRIPLGRLALDDRDVARGAVFFPFVGAAVGALTGGVAVTLEGPLPPLLAAAVAVALEAVVTGAIHLDALADFADGLGAGSRARALEIMGEPAIGAFGGVALVLDLLLKTVAISALLAEDRAVVAVAAASALGRAGPLALAWALPYARAGAGSGRVLTDGAARWLLAVGLALATAGAIALVGVRSLALVAGAAATIGVIGATAWRRLGGVTGDVLGASIELSTTVALLAAVATR